jgi:hypothetical protein
MNTSCFKNEFRKRIRILNNIQNLSLLMLLFSVLGSELLQSQLATCNQFEVLNTSAPGKQILHYKIMSVFSILYIISIVVIKAKII